jgi:hypothetical protein
MGVPVERFDPTDGYVTGEADIPEGRGGDFAVATGLALMGVLEGAYRIEILSEAARRRKEFASSTLWLALAGAAILAHLVIAFVVTRGNHERATADLGRLRAEMNARNADVQRFERTSQEAREAAARLARLEDLTAPGSGLLATLDLLDACLPGELWVRSIRTQRAIEPELGHGGVRRPFVVVEGSGKEQSRNLSDAVTELTTRMRAEPSIATILPRFTTDNRGSFNFTLSVDSSIFPDETASDAASDAAGTAVEDA